jgi:hypothetical protein
MKVELSFGLEPLEQRLLLSGDLGQALAVEALATTDDFGAERVFEETPVREEGAEAIEYRPGEGLPSLFAGPPAAGDGEVDEAAAAGAAAGESEAMNPAGLAPADELAADQPLAGTPAEPGDERVATLRAPRGPPTGPVSQTPETLAGAEGQVMIDAGEVLTGSGVLAVPVFNRGGLVDPGDPWGTLAMPGYTQFEPAVLRIDVWRDAGGWLAGDALDVAGDVTLGGQIVLNLDEDCQPVPGESLTIIEWAGRRSGAFDAWLGTVGFGDGLYFHPVYEEGSLRLEVRHNSLLTGADQTGLLSLLDGLADAADLVDGLGALGETIPGLADNALGSLADTGTFLREVLRGALDDLFDEATALFKTEVTTALEALDDGGPVAGYTITVAGVTLTDEAGGDFWWDLDLTAERGFSDHLDPGTAPAFGAGFSASVDLDGTSIFELGLRFGRRADSGGFFVALDEFVARVEIAASGLELGLDLPDLAGLTASVTGGTVTLEAEIAVTARAGVTTGAGLSAATLGEIGGGVAASGAFELAARGSIDAVLPLSAGLAPGAANFSLSGVTARLQSADLFAGDLNLRFDSTGLGLGAGVETENFTGSFSVRRDGDDTVIEATVDEFLVEAEGTRILRGHGSGTLLIYEAAGGGHEVAGLVALAIDEGPAALDMTLAGNFSLRINTGDEVITDLAGTGLDLPAGPYLRIEGEGELVIGGGGGAPGATLAGDFVIEQVTDGGDELVYFGMKNLETSFSDDRGVLLAVTMAAGGSAAFVFEGDGFAGRADGLTIDLEVADVTHIAGTFALLANTMAGAVNRTLTLPDGTVVAIEVAAGPFLRVDGSGVELTFNMDGTVLVAGGNFSFEQRELAGRGRVLTVGVTEFATSLTDGDSPATELLSVTGGTAGLIFSRDGVAGTVEAAVTLGAELATSVALAAGAGLFRVEINTTDEEVEETITVQQVAGGTATGVTVALDLPAGPYMRISATGAELVLTIGGAQQSLTGNFSIEQGGSGSRKFLKVGASDVAATLGPAGLELIASGGSGAFLINADGIAGVATVENLELGADFPLTVEATNLRLEFNNTGGDVPATEIITSADPDTTLTIEFGPAFTGDTSHHDFFAIAGAAVLETGWVDLEGTFRFRKSNTADRIEVGAAAVGLTFAAGGTEILSFRNGEGAFVIDDDGVAGRVDLEFEVGLVSLSGDISLEVNTTGAAVNTTVPTGAEGGPVVLDLEAGDYLRVEVSDGQLQLWSLGIPIDFVVEKDLGADTLRLTSGENLLLTVDAAGDIALGPYLEDMVDGITTVFVEPSPEAVVAMLRTLANWLSIFEDSDVFDYEIPFTDTTLGEALDWSSAFLDDVYYGLVGFGFRSGRAFDFTGGVDLEIPAGAFSLRLGGEVVEFNTTAIAGAYASHDAFTEALEGLIDDGLAGAGLDNGLVDLVFSQVEDSHFLNFNLAGDAVSELGSLVMESAGIFGGGVFGFSDGMAAVESVLADTMEELVAGLNDALGLTGDDRVVYDEMARMIVWPVNLTKTYTHSVPLDFGRELGDIGEASLDGEILLAVDLGMAFTLGIDWGPADVPRLLSNMFTPTPSNGRITQDAHFTLRLNQDAAQDFDLTLAAGSTGSHSSIEQLAQAIDDLFDPHTFTHLGQSYRLGDLLHVQKAGNGIAISVVHEVDEDGDGEPDRDLNGNGTLDDFLGLINKLEIIVAQHDTFATEVGFGAEICDADGVAPDPDSTPGPDEGGYFKSTSVVTQRGLFLDNINLSAELKVITPGGISGSLVLGFVELGVAGGYFGTDDPATGLAPDHPDYPTGPEDEGWDDLEGIGLSLTVQDERNGSGRFYLADLFTSSDSSSIRHITPDLDFAGGLFAGLGDITVGVGSVDFGLADLLGSSDDALISISIPDITNLEFNPRPYDPVGNNQGIFVTYPDFGELLDFRDFGFNDVVRALRVLVDMLSDLDGFGFLDYDIPLINTSVSDMIDCVGDVATLVERIAATPVGSIQGVIERFQSELVELFDLDPEEEWVAMDGGDVIKFRLEFETGYADSFPLQLSLDDLIGFIAGDSGPSSAFLEGVTDFVSIGGSGVLTVNAGARLRLTFGIDFSDTGDVKLFLYDGADGTAISLTAKVLGTDVEFEAALGGVFGIYVRDGSVTIDADGDPATTDPASFDIVLDGGDDGRVYFDDSFLSDATIRLAVVAGVSALLPVYFPDEGIPLGGDDDENGDGYPDNLLAIDIPDLVRLFAGDKADGNTVTMAFRGDNNDLRITGPVDDYEVKLRQDENLNAMANAVYDAASKTLTVTIDSGETTAAAVQAAIQRPGGLDGGLPGGRRGRACGQDHHRHARFQRRLRRPLALPDHQQLRRRDAGRLRLPARGHPGRARRDRLQRPAAAHRRQPGRRGRLHRGLPRKRHQRTARAHRGQRRGAGGAGGRHQGGALVHPGPGGHRHPGQSRRQRPRPRPRP